MDNSVPKATEATPIVDAAKENVEANIAPSEIDNIASNAIIAVTVGSSVDNQGNPSITVDWHPHVYYSTLTKLHNGSAETVLDRYESGSPIYYDSNVRYGNTYQYVLHVDKNPHSPFYSRPIKLLQTERHPIFPQPTNIDETKRSYAS